MAPHVLGVGATFRTWVNYGDRMPNAVFCTPERRSFGACVHATSVRAHAPCRQYTRRLGPGPQRGVLLMAGGR